MSRRGRLIVQHACVKSRVEVATTGFTEGQRRGSALWVVSYKLQVVACPKVANHPLDEIQTQTGNGYMDTWIHSGSGQIDALTSI